MSWRSIFINIKFYYIYITKIITLEWWFLMGAILSTKVHLAMSGDIFDFQNLGAGMPLGLMGMLLTVLLWTGRLPTVNIIWSLMSIVPWSRNAVLEYLDHLLMKLNSKKYALSPIEAKQKHELSFSPMFSVIWNCLAFQRYLVVFTWHELQQEKFSFCRQSP